MDLSATPGHQRVSVTVRVNGVEHTRQVSPRQLLSDFLRHELGLTGTHVGCEHGVCGCCTVLLGGRAARSCLTLAVQAAGAEITTIEGLAEPDGSLHPIQQAMRECHGLQCGFCTPGFIMSIHEFLNFDHSIDLSEKGIREGISGNLCRCTGYQGIANAVRRAAELMGRSSESGTR